MKPHKNVFNLAEKFGFIRYKDGIDWSSNYDKELVALVEALEQQEVGDAEIKQMLNDIEYYQKRVEELEAELEEKNHDIR